jgi:hypothetical protein
MKQLRAITAFLVGLSALNACHSGSREQQKARPLSRDEQFWVDFSGALRKEDTKYLLAHSLDTIQCGDCALNAGGESEFFETSFLFTNHIDHFKPKEHFQEYSIYNDEGVYRVNYRIKWRQAPAGAYNVIYNFVETAEGFKFQGMFPGP